MTSREPVILAILIETKLLRWSAGGIQFNGEAFPLIQSEDGNLDEYKDLEIDSQISFLRHRLAGVLQRGCDRLFAREMKADHFLIIGDDLYPNADVALTPRLANHFVEWMVNPPVTYLVATKSFDLDPSLQVIAGKLHGEVEKALRNGLPKLVKLLEICDKWERIARPPRAEIPK